MKKFIYIVSIFIIVICNSIPCFAEWQGGPDDWMYHLIPGTYPSDAPVKERGADKYATGKWWYIEGMYYAFGDDGYMLKNQVVEGHQLNTDGQLLDDKGNIYTNSPASASPKGFVSCIDTCYNKITGDYNQKSTVTLNISGYDLHYRKDCSGFASICVELYNILNYDTRASEPIFSSANYPNLKDFHFNPIATKDYITQSDIQAGDIWIKPRTEGEGNGNGHVIMVTDVKRDNTTNTFQYTFKHLTSKKGKRTTKVNVIAFSLGEGTDGVTKGLVVGGECGSEGYTKFYRTS